MKTPRSCSAGSSGHGALLLLLVCCLCSSVARSQTADSCASTTGLAAVIRQLIPFDTSNLTCLDAWSSQGFVLRVRLPEPSPVITSLPARVVVSVC
jgi:hypothetical protein